MDNTQSCLYYLMQFDEMGNLIMFSKTGYTDINRAQAICDRLNREYDFFFFLKEDRQAYIYSNENIIAYKKEVSDYETKIYTLYTKQDNTSQQLLKNFDNLIAKCNYNIRILQLTLKEEWEASTNFYDDNREYYTYSLQKLKIK